MDDPPLEAPPALLDLRALRVGPGQVGAIPPEEEVEVGDGPDGLARLRVLDLGLGLRDLGEGTAVCTKGFSWGQEKEKAKEKTHRICRG